MAAYTYILPGHGKFKGRYLSAFLQKQDIHSPIIGEIYSSSVLLIISLHPFCPISVSCDVCMPSASFLVQFPMYFMAGGRELWNSVLCNKQGQPETAAYRPRRQLTRSIALVGIYTQPENWLNVFFCSNCGFSSKFGFPNAFCTIVWSMESCSLFHLFTRPRLQMLPAVKEGSS